MHWRKRNMRAGVDQMPRFKREPLPSHPAELVFYAIVAVAAGLGWAALLVAMVS